MELTTRTKTMRDFDLELESFSEVTRLLKESSGFDSTNPQNANAKLVVSQNLHSIFLGDPNALIKGGKAPQNLQWLVDFVADILEDISFTTSDFDDRPATFSANHRDAAAYQLLVAALKKRQTALVQSAVELLPISQSSLLEYYCVDPVSENDDELQRALNRYSRNQRVRRKKHFIKKRHERPRVVLHAGITKTGSTYLQHLMDENRPALLRKGVWYPEVGLFWQNSRPHKQSGHSGFTSTAVQKDPELRRYIQSGLDLMQGQVHTIVLSSEAFFLQEQSHRIAEYLKDYPLEVVLYLRRQDEWANSQYCEFVGGGAVGRVSMPIQDWLSLDKVRSLLDYRTTIDRFASVVPREKIIPRVYERSMLKDCDLVADFADAARLPELLDIPRPPVQKSNDARLSAGHIELLRHFNSREFASQEAYFNFIEEVAQRITSWRAERGIELPKAMLLSVSERRRVLNDFSAANADLSKNWFAQTDGQIFDDTLPEIDPQPSVIDSEETAIIHSAFERWVNSGEEHPRENYPQMRASGDYMARTANLSEQYLVVNYGLFGWRRWGLTPFVRPHVAKLGSQKDIEFFDHEPALFMHSLESPRYRRLAQRLYPQTSVLGPGDIFGLSRRPLSWAALKLGGPKYQKGFIDHPVLFFRLLRSPIYRAFGRIIFPMGELRRRDRLPTGFGD